MRSVPSPWLLGLLAWSLLAASAGCHRRANDKTAPGQSLSTRTLSHLSPSSPAQSAAVAERSASPASSVAAGSSPPAPSASSSSRPSKPPSAVASISPQHESATGCPSDMVPIRNFCIDRYEAYLVTVDAQGKEHEHPFNERPDDSARYEARNAAGHMPQAYINRFEAAAACRHAGKRLCSLREWYLACQGPRHTVWPYGNRYQKGRCNQAKPHLLSKLYGTKPKRWTYEAFNDPRLDSTPGFLAPSGQYEGCTNDYGVFDMVGNLHEWVRDQVDHSLVHKIPLRDDIRDKIEKNSGHGIFMGGFFSTTNEHGKGCRFLTPGHGPKYHDYSTGFRCCRNRSP